MAENVQFIDERLSNSITAVVPVADPIDRLRPLTFTDWLKYNTQLFTTTTEFLNRYQSYLTNWYAANGATKEQASAGVEAYYTNLITEIAISYSSPDEQRYLQNIDTTNTRDLAIAVPFFAQKIKEICLYYSTLRDDVQTAATQYSLKGSNVGIENLLYVNIIKSLQSQDIGSRLTTLGLNLSTISNNININIEDLYDTYADYYDISPTLPASAYNVSTGARNEYFALNRVDFDPYLYINLNQSILKAILSYPFYALELGDAFTIDPLVNSSQLNLLKDSDYISTVNDGDINNLNLQNTSNEITKYIGTDFYYIATDTYTAFTSGMLFKADNDFANVLNKRYPTVAAVPSEEFLKTGKEIGFFFKPDKTGLTHFTNFGLKASIDLSKLQPNSVYYFPDPSKYGNISGNTKLEFQSPITFFEENYFNKVDFSNQNKFGDVATDPYYQLFRAYQTREQSLNYTNAGIQRYVDSQTFFTGDQDSIWANVDVYPLTPTGELSIDSRYDSLIPTNKSLVKYKSDVYGNQYGLYKTSSNKQFSTTSTVKTFLDYVFDGYVFNLQGTDPNWPGWNVANSNVTTSTYTPYGSALYYSGVTLKTSVDEIIAADGNTPIYTTGLLPDGTSYIDDGATFNDGNKAIVIESYGFDTNDAYYGFVAPTINYTCLVRDGVTFTRIDNTFLPDTPSDSSLYNPNSYLFYNELVDAAPQPSGPYGAANFGNQASFLFDPNTYTTITYDGNVFYDANINTGPCDTIIYHRAYNEPTNFVNARPANKTILDYSLSGVNATKNSLYYTRNIEYGDFYFRNASDTVIGPLSSTLSAAFISFSSDVQNEIYNNVIGFDLYYDVLQIETENYLIFEKIAYDYEHNEIIGAANNHSILARGSNTELEKFSTVWFDEGSNKLMVCVMTLHYKLSATNYKAIYPTIYTIDINTAQAVQIYPSVRDKDLTFNQLSAFSLFGKGIELNIVKIEKPTLTYSEDTAYYTLTYLGKDTANCFYIITTRFQYIQNIVQNVTCTLHKPATDVYHVTFGNQLPTGTYTGSSLIDTYTAIGSATGYVDYTDNTFTWGYNTNA
jgi:hypothetical protein